VKVVFDSNIYVSALVMPGGVADHAIRAVTQAAVELFISRPIFDEVLGVMSRKFARAPEELARTALYLASLAAIVAPARRIHMLTDEPDNRVLECASAAGADLIVTGDREMLSLGAWEGIEIVSLRQFVDRLGSAPGVHQSRVRYRVKKAA
jgi:putative PIN family toxin of toxin-antitoxin system